MRLDQLKTLAALRDSGALTQAEFDAEKRRILGE
ncbi:SHOCT domain-containing protein [Mycolicibacterium helvum]|nr:SHOCT domain-containing protein [Mycolicibacterium helvum]